MSKNIPSLDPANNGSLSGVMRSGFKKFLENVDDMLPVEVIAFEPGAPAYVAVQPLILIKGTDGNTYPRDKYPKIPVLTLGGGGIVLYFSLKPGDLGWLKANDRDISLFMQYFQPSAPNTIRQHSFSDAIFIPHAMINYVIAEEDLDNTVLQSLDGTVKISLGVGKIKIAAPIVEIDSATAINISSPVAVNITTPLTTIDGDLLVTGTIT
jgi:hypothetical protein